MINYIIRFAMVSVALWGVCVAGNANTLKGFYYGDDVAPGGHEWQ